MSSRREPKCILESSAQLWLSNRFCSGSESDGAFFSAMSHMDVDIPAILHPLLSTLLADFEVFLNEQQQGPCWRVAKPPGGHITPWWIYLRLSTEAPVSSVVKFGETIFAEVNPVPHLWVRGKARWIDAGFQLLTDFVARTLTRTLQQAAQPPPPPPLRPPQPTRPPPRPSTPEVLVEAVEEDKELMVLADFDGAAFGDEYLILKKDDRIMPRAPPTGLDPEGWTFGLHCDSGRQGWYPGHYAH
jgi:hypothetical protein